MKRGKQAGVVLLRTKYVANPDVARSSADAVRAVLKRRAAGTKHFGVSGADSLDARYRDAQIRPPED